MWLYAIATGQLTHDGAFEGFGYSGAITGRNNVQCCSIPNVGPIPPGDYTIGPVYEHPTLGPFVMNLTPLPGTNTFGRDLFRIHGDNANHDASHGCVILGRSQRVAISKSDDNLLRVTA